MTEAQKNEFLVMVFESFMKNSQDMIFVKDVNLKYITASIPFMKMCGCESIEKLIGKTDFDFFDRELAQKYCDDDAGVINSGKCIENYIEPLPEQYGKKSYSSTSKYIIQDKEGNTVGIYGIARDVTEKIELEAERENSRLSRAMFDVVLEADLTENRMLSSEGESDWVREMKVLEGSSFFCAIAKFAESYLCENDRKDFLEMYNSAKLEHDYMCGVDEFQHLVYARFYGKKYCWTEFRSRVYHSRVTDSLRITTFIKDVDQEIKHRQTLQKRARTDVLTGLNNREAVFEEITRYLNNKEEQESYALLFVDLDNFKLINDNWGHQYGDKVLKQIADKMESQSGKNYILGRIGGDEFLVFLKGIANAQEVKAKTEYLLNVLTVSPEDTCKLKVTCSVGITIGMNGKATIDELICQADEAMYKAKECGKNQLYFYDGITRIDGLQ